MTKSFCSDLHHYMNFHYYFFMNEEIIQLIASFMFFNEFN